MKRRDLLKQDVKAITALNMYMHEKRGPYIDLRLLKLSYHHYTETTQGVKVRFVKNKNNIIQKRELIFEPYLKEIDFEQNTVIFNFNDEGSFFPLHHHIEAEWMIPVKGEIFDKFNNVLTLEGEKVSFDPMVPHELHFKEPSAILVVINPPAF